MTTVHAQTGIKLATKPAKTSLLGGHFIYKANGTGETPSSANVVEWVDNNPALWGHNVHIGSNGIKLRYGETTLSKWDTDSLIFYKPRVENGSIVTDKGIEITSSGIDIFSRLSNTNKKVASFGEIIVLGQNENNNVRTEISGIDFSIIEKNYQGQDTKIFSLNAGEYIGNMSFLNPNLTFGDRNVIPPSVAYDDTSTYWVGKTCIYDNEEYVCKEQIDTPEAFDSSKWKKVVGYYSSAFGAYNVAAGTHSFAEGFDVTAIGDYSHAEGHSSIACGNYSHAEGDSHANGNYSHAEGYDTNANGNYSHAEGYNADANGNYSHAEGHSAYVTGDYSHAEGYSTLVAGNYSHAEGYDTNAGGDYSHAEGYDKSASGTASHAEGYGTSAYGDYSHAMGKGTIAGNYQTAMGQYNAIDSSASFIIGNGSSDSNRSNLFTITNAGDLKIKSNNIWIINGTDEKNYLKIGYDVLEFFMNVDNVKTSVASFGVSARIGQIANGKSRVEIKDTGIDFYNRTSNQDVTLAHIGYDTGKTSGGSTSTSKFPYYTFGLRNSDSSTTRGNYSFAEGDNTTASGYSSHAEGSYTTASGGYSHAEGDLTNASGPCSHAEGNRTTASGHMSHAEGYYTTAGTYYSHAEGYQSTANGECSHVEGKHTTAATTGYCSHAEGCNTTVSNSYCHAEGFETTASGYCSHAQNNSTIAGYHSQTAIGKYNNNNSNNAFEIGNGSSGSPSNAFAVDWNGVARLAGSLFTGCSSDSTGGYEFGRKTGNHVVIGGIHICWGLETITHTSSGYKEVQVTLPYTYTSAPKCFASYGNRSTSGAPRTASATQGSLAGNKIYVGSYATGSVDAYVNWMTIGV